MIGLLRHASVMFLLAMLAACGGSGGGGGSIYSLTASAASGSTDETGTTATFTVVLDVEPIGNVTVAVSSADTGEVTIQDGASLTFTRSNWNVAQTVTVAGVDDSEVDGTVNVTVTATAGSGGGYDGESDTVTIANADDGKEMWPSKDNTLYEDDQNPARWSNGAGQHLFAGRTGQGANSIRRALIAFDIAATVPAGAMINNATLRMNMSLTNGAAGVRNIVLRRMLVDWGEAGSDQPGNEGGNNIVAAETGDATWTNGFHDDGGASAWDTVGAGGAGADFDNTAVTPPTLSVDAVGSYEWSGAQLIADVQDMLDTPASNFGWIILGDETQATTAKRFDTKENAILLDRPTLILDYTPP